MPQQQKSVMRENPRVLEIVHLFPDRLSMEKIGSEVFTAPICRTPKQGSLNKLPKLSIKNAFGSVNLTVKSMP